MLLPGARLLLAAGAIAIIPLGMYTVAYIANIGSKSLYDSKEYTIKDKAKFGYEFSHYFLSTIHTSNTSEGLSRIDILKNRTTQGKEEEFFKDIKTNADIETIKRKCKDKYEEAGNINESERDKGKGVGIYCSMGGTKPTTILEANQQKESVYISDKRDTYGKDLKDKLISTEDPSNEGFGNLRHKAFKSGFLRSEVKSEFFSTKTTASIKNICKRAYELQNTTSNPSSETVKKYCSI